MGAGNVIPELINGYEVYINDNRMIGVSGEVELPNLEALTDTMEVAGVLGEADAPATGQFAAMKIKIPFAILHENIFEMTDTTKAVELTLRSSQQFIDQRTYDTDYSPVKIVIRGKTTTTTLGKLLKGKKGSPEVELEIYYIKIVINNSVELELDKINYIYNLHGKDMLAKIREHLGWT